MGMFSGLSFLMGDGDDDMDMFPALRLEYLNIGPSPVDEDCVQVSNGDYVRAMREEVSAYVVMLEKRFPNPPDNTGIMIKWFDHDFGRYAEAVVVYDPDCEDSARYAYFVENNTPMRWDDFDIIDWRRTA